MSSRGFTTKGGGGEGSATSAILSQTGYGGGIGGRSVDI